VPFGQLRRLCVLDVRFSVIYAPSESSTFAELQSLADLRELIIAFDAVDHQQLRAWYFDHHPHKMCGRRDNNDDGDANDARGRRCAAGVCRRAAEPTTP
jgi:hypothetical protein